MAGAALATGVTPIELKEIVYRAVAHVGGAGPLPQILPRTSVHGREQQPRDPHW